MKVDGILISGMKSWMRIKKFKVGLPRATNTKHHR